MPPTTIMVLAQAGQARYRRMPRRSARADIAGSGFPRRGASHPWWPCGIFASDPGVETVVPAPALVGCSHTATVWRGALAVPVGRPRTSECGLQPLLVIVLTPDRLTGIRAGQDSAPKVTLKTLSSLGMKLSSKQWPSFLPWAIRLLLREIPPISRLCHRPAQPRGLE